VGTSYNSSFLFVHFMHLSLLCFIIIIIVKVMSQSSHLPWGFVKSDPLGGALFVLTHFRALHSTSNHFPSCLFPSIVDDTHIIGPPSIVSYVYEHFQTKFHVIGFSIQLQKCVAWSPFSLSLDFNTPSQFTTLFEGIKVLGVLSSTLTFTSFFIKDAFLEDVRHVDIFHRMGNVQVAFRISIRCLVNAHCIFYDAHLHLPPSQSLLFFSIFPSFKCLDAFWV